MPFAINIITKYCIFTFLLLLTHQSRSSLFSFLSLLSSLGTCHCHTGYVHSSHQWPALDGNTLDKRDCFALLVCRMTMIDQQIKYFGARFADSMNVPIMIHRHAVQ